MEYLVFAYILLAGYHYYVQNVIVPGREAKVQGKLYPLFKRTSEIISESNDTQVTEVAKELRRMMVITARDIRQHNYLAFKIYEYKNAHRHKEEEEKTKEKYESAFSQYPELRYIFN